MCQSHEEFVCVELKPRLAELLKIRSEISDEIDEYNKLLEIVQALKHKKNAEYYTRSDIGLGYEVEAVVHDPSLLYVHVGMGFHVEMELESIPAFAAQRQDLLRARLGVVQEDCDKVANHIQEVRTCNHVSCMWRFPCSHTKCCVMQSLSMIKQLKEL